MRACAPTISACCAPGAARRSGPPASASPIWPRPNRTASACPAPYVWVCRSSSTSARSLKLGRLGWILLAAWFGLASVWFSEHVQISDDSFYSYCTRQVLRGQVPYRDFPFYQPPLLLYAYAPFFAVFGSSVAVGRWVTLVLLAGGVSLASLAAYRQGGRAAAFVTALLMAGNLSFLFNCTSVKTQGWTLLWLGVMLASLGRWWLATGAACLAVLTRVSMLPVPLLLAVYLGWRNRRQGALSLLMSSLVIGGAVALWSHLSEGRLSYDLYGVHLDMVAMNPRPVAEVKLDALLMLLLNQGLVSTLALISLRPPLTAFPAFLGAVWLACSAIHLLAPTTYPTYQDSILPLAAVLVGCRLGGWLTASPLRLGALVAATLAFNVLQWRQYQAWFHPAPLRASERLAHDVARLCPPDRKVMTFVLELPLAAGRDVYPGMEYAEFSFRPDPVRWPDDWCRHLRMLNTSMLLQAILRREPGLIILPPLNEQIQGVIEQGYTKAGEAEVRPGLRLPFYVPNP